MPSLLIVDRDDASRSRFHELLRDSGVQLAEASDVGSAVDLMRETHFDLVVIDPVGQEREGCISLRDTARKDEVRLVVAGVASASGAKPALSKPWPGGTELLQKLGLGEGGVQTATVDPEAGIRSLEAELNLARERCKDLEQRAEEHQQILEQARDSFNHDISRMMNIVSNIMDGILFTDADGEISLINPIAEEMLGIRAFMSVGRSLFDLEGGELVEAVQGCIDNVRDWRETNVVVEVHEEGQDLAYIRLRAMQVRNYKGDPAGILIQLQDVTRDHKTDQLKNQYLSIVAHELRTPLTGIKTCSTMMAKGMAGDLDEKQKTLVESIREQSLRLEHQIDKLVNLGNLESNEFAQDLARFDLRPLVEQAVQPFGQVAAERDIRLEVDLPEDDCEIEGDRSDLRRALQALLENAVKFGRDGGFVRVALQPGESGIRLSVADDGVGIEPRYQRRIFEKFFQVEDPLTRHHGGSGLGLFFVDNIVKAHGAEVVVESQLGEGARFSFTFSRAPADETEASACSGAPETRS